ncbi:exosortase N [Carboxylicivirga taeanensis]|uniref:exosortase N n=1 Tax=Carboxylicivirga taeanensis TaxID=1416875 RepID=UPI003F6E43A7
MCRVTVQLVTGISSWVAKGRRALLQPQCRVYLYTGLMLLAAVPVFISYGGLHFEQAMFFMALPFTLQKAGNQSFPRLTASAALVFLLVYYVVHVYSIFYLGFGLALLLTLMRTAYRPTLLSYALLLITVPAFQYAFQAFSFSIRLQLTSFAVKVLQVMYPTIEQVGNRMVLNDISYTVAPECMGLNMLTSALVMALCLIAFKAKRHDLRAGVKVISLVMLAAIGFVMIGNVSRIILTVIFKAMPSTALHELIGLLVFAANICVPLILFVAVGTRLYLPAYVEVKHLVNIPRMLLIIIISVVFSSVFITKNQLKDEAGPLTIEIPHMNRTVGSDGIVKLSSEEALVYIKPPAFFLGADHHPFICWRASGYQVQEEELEEVNGHEVYTFKLTKDHEPPIFSCWWYSNGQSQTCSQLKWRLAPLTDEAPYSVINVSAKSKEACLKLALQLLE